MSYLEKNYGVMKRLNCISKQQKFLIVYVFWYSWIIKSHNLAWHCFNMPQIYCIEVPMEYEPQGHGIELISTIDFWYIKVKHHMTLNRIRQGKLKIIQTMKFVVQLWYFVSYRERCEMSFVNFSSLNCGHNNGNVRYLMTYPWGTFISNANYTLTDIYLRDTGRFIARMFCFSCRYSICTQLLHWRGILIWQSFMEQDITLKFT